MDMLTRRNFLKSTCAFPFVIGRPSWAHEAKERWVDEFWIRPRKIRMSHVSGDFIEIMYWSDGEIIPQAYAELCWFMRDRVVQKAILMNPVLFDINYGVCGWLDYYGVKESPMLTSGHRDYHRNLGIEGAVMNSKHVTGDAGDERIRGISTLQVARFGVWLAGGGVGWYPNKNFVHLDTGRLRVWKG